MDCIDTATAKPALDNAADYATRAVRAAKLGDTATAAAHMRLAAYRLRQAASASSADPAVSQPLMKAAEAYDKAATAYASGDETGAKLFVLAFNAFLENATDALRQSSVPRCR